MESRWLEFGIWQIGVLAGIVGHFRVLPGAQAAWPSGLIGFGVRIGVPDHYSVMPMKIEKNTAVTLRYKISDRLGKVLEQSDEPMAYLHGGYGNTFAKIEEALEGQEAGHRITLELQPQDAYGVRDESLLQAIPKTEFPPGVKVGGQLRGQDENGQAQVFTVLKVKGDKVFLDGNHPFAGMTLRFDVQVTEVRLASEEEVAHGHVHGAHGHHH